MGRLKVTCCSPAWLFFHVGIPVDADPLLILQPETHEIPSEIIPRSRNPHELIHRNNILFYKAQKLVGITT
jgi:hypothetical protein